MLIGTFFAVALGLSFGIPLLPILMLAALLQGVIAYALTSCGTVFLSIGLVVMAAFGQFVMIPMLSAQGEAIYPEILLDLITYGVYAITVLSFMTSTVIGVTGNRRARSPN